MTMLQADQMNAFIKRQDFHDKTKAAIGCLAFGSLLGGLAGIVGSGIVFSVLAALSSTPISATASAFFVISVATSAGLGAAAAPVFVSHEQDMKRISKKLSLNFKLLGVGATLACALFAGAKVKNALEEAEKERASITAVTALSLTERGVLAKALASAQQRSDTPAIVTLPVKKLRMVQSI